MAGLDKNMVRIYIRNLREKEDRYRQMKLAGGKPPRAAPCFLGALETLTTSRRRFGWWYVTELPF